MTSRNEFATGGLLLMIFCGIGVFLRSMPGQLWSFFVARPFWVLVHRGEETKGRSQRRMESLAFRTIGRDQAFLRKFVGEIVPATTGR